jgi:hypothetical protein
LDKQVRIPPHISTPEWSDRSAFSRIETVLDNPKRDADEPVAFSVRPKSSIGAAERRAQLRLVESSRHAPQRPALSRGYAAEDQWWDGGPSRKFHLDVVKWYAVASLFASVALVMIVLFLLFLLS